MSGQSCDMCHGYGKVRIFENWYPCPICNDTRKKSAYIDENGKTRILDEDGNETGAQG